MDATNFCKKSVEQIYAARSRVIRWVKPAAAAVIEISNGIEAALLAQVRAELTHQVHHEDAAALANTNETINKL